MKRSLPFTPILFLLLLNACNTEASMLSDQEWTAAVNTQTAAMWTPTPTETPNPIIPGLVDWLNAELSNIDPLEQSLDARYRVTNVSFPLIPDSSSVVFRVEVRCECATNAKCCIPERTFVVVVTSMKKSIIRLWEQVPTGVSEMRVVCADHDEAIGVVSASWRDVRDYLDGDISGYQLGPRVSRVSNP